MIRCEQPILLLLRRKPWFAGRALGQLPDAERLYRSNAERLAELERGAGRLIGSAHDLYAGLPAGARKALNPVARRAQRETAPESAANEAAPASPAAPVPFGPEFPRAAAPAVAAIVHLFDISLAREIRVYLETVPIRTDLFLSTDTPAKRDALLSAFAGWDRGGLEIALAPNRGRDIAPKLVTFRSVYDRYPYVLHLHGKSSPHDANLRLWRYYIFETLLGEARIVSDVLAAFEREPRLGMVAPQHFYPVRASISWGPNFAPAERLARRMGIRLDPAAPLDFPSGSMFWARSAALRPLLDLGLSAEDFDEEAGQKDATLAHAIERLYFHACAKAGFGWMKIVRPELAYREANGHAPASPEDLARHLPPFAVARS